MMHYLGGHCFKTNHFASVRRWFGTLARWVMDIPQKNGIKNLAYKQIILCVTVCLVNCQKIIFCLNTRRNEIHAATLLVSDILQRLINDPPSEEADHQNGSHNPNDGGYCNPTNAETTA